MLEAVGILGRGNNMNVYLEAEQGPATVAGT